MHIQSMGVFSVSFWLRHKNSNKVYFSEGLCLCPIRIIYR